jgi:hypothetical protein
MSRLFAVLGALIALGCTPDPPPRWATGGAPLVLATAYWEREDEPVIHLTPGGEVYQGEDLAYVIDRVGRVTTSDYEPYAVLTDDGRLVGTGNLSYGRVGLSNASPPDQRHAWLSVGADGQVVYFDNDGERHPAGAWRGCGGYVARTCTLVTHLFTIRTLSRRRERSPFMGPSFGVILAP